MLFRSPALTPYIKPANDAAAAAASFYINNTNAKDYSALASQLIAVASVDENGVISSFSNRCGVAADWCISAPGGQIYSTVPEHTYDTYDGTSMAAPHVAGAVALLIDKYPALTPAQVVTRLLTSANKTGIYADTSVYGQGMLDLSTATSFMARPLVLTGSTLSGPSFDLTQSRIRLGSAFGDGLTRSLSQRDVTIVDSFDGANFEMKGDVLTEAGDLSNRMEDGIRRFGAETHTLELNDGGDTIVSWRSVPGGTSGERDKTETRVTTHFSENTSVSAGYMADPSLGFGLMAEGTLNDGESRSKGAFLSPYLGLVSDGMSFAAQSKFGDFTVRAASFTGNAEDEDDQSGYGAATELAYTPFRGGSLALQAGFVSEEDTFLGSESGGAFALGQSDTTYAGVSGSLSIMPKTELVGSYFLGMSNVDAAPGSLFTSLGNIQSDAFSLGLIQHDTAVQDDRLGFLLNQPLRVSSGSASLRLPTNLNREHDVSYSLTNAGLTPTGREMDVEAFYAAPVDEHTNVNASVMYRHQPDHIATAPDEAQMLLHVNHKY